MFVRARTAVRYTYTAAARRAAAAAARGGRAPRVSYRDATDIYRRRWQRLRTAGCFLLARYRPTMHSTAVVMLRMI